MESRNELFGRNPRRAAALRPLACIGALLFGLAAACTPAGPRPRGADVPHPARAPAHGPADTLTLVLLGTTDVHGWIYPYDYYALAEAPHGLGLLAPLVDSVRAAHPGRVYLFDSGDLLQGTPFALVYARVERGAPNPIIRAMDLLGYTAGTIGNHEFDYGVEHLDRAVAQAGFPFVSANIFRAGTQDHAYAPYALVPHVAPGGDTLLIGITGTTTPGTALWNRARVEGVLEFRDPVVSLRPIVAELRARGADLVVVLSHGGLEGSSYDAAELGLPPENDAARAAREVEGIDVIFLGHTHRELADTTIGNTLLLQAGNWARSLAAAEVRLARRGRGTWSVVSRSGSLLRPDPGRVGTALLDAVLAAHQRTLAYVNSVIGRATATLSASEARVRDTPLMDFINEVQRRATGADLSAAAAFRLDAALPRGPITIADVAGVYIYENTLRAVRITGAQLKAFLEKSAEYYRGWPPPGGGTVTNFDVPGYNFDVVSGVDYVIDLSRPVGNRIVELRYQGQPVRPDQTFTMAVNSYRQSGGGGYTMLANAPVVYDRGEDIRELLIEEVRRRGEIRPGDDFRENWRIVPAAAAERALAEQLERETRVLAAAPAGTPVLAAPLVRSPGESTLGRVVADAIRWAAGTQIALVGSASLGADLGAGPAEAAAVRRVLPEPGSIVRLYMSGIQLRALLEQVLGQGPPAAALSGAIVHYDAAAPPGSRVLTVRLEDGLELQPDLVYSVAVPADLVDGAAALPALAHAFAREDTGRGPAEALLDYLNTMPQPVRPPRDARFRPAAAAEGRANGGGTPQRPRDRTP